MGAKLEKYVLNGSRERQILMDTRITSSNSPNIIFCHGYKGYKDWGAWNLMADSLAKDGFNVFKFNFSYNGGTVDDPIDFPDLEAFGKNTYSTELDDLKIVINWVSSRYEGDIGLMGHSRGGGIVLLAACESEEVKAVVTLASVSDYKSRFPSGEELADWKEKGVYFVKNTRTNQDMPHHLSFYTDFIENESRLDILDRVKKLKIPTLIIHARDDQSVEVSNAKELHNAIPHAEMSLLNTGGHTFGSNHPWNGKSMPPELDACVEQSALFFRKYLS